MIDARDCAYIMELFGDVKKDEPVDFMLETSGGATDATESLVSLLHNIIDDFRVIVADSAKSNGTLLGLAAKSIVMGASSELGPIEPLVNGIPCSILIQGQIAASNFPLHKFGEYALQQTRKLAKTLLTNGMMQGRPEAEIDATVQSLASRDIYHSHGSAINYVEANGLGLKVEYLPPENEVWKHIWLLHCMYQHDCRTNNYLKIFEGRSRSTALAVPSPAKP
jgi:hypothetical protein